MACFSLKAIYTVRLYFGAVLYLLILAVVESNLSLLNRKFSFKKTPLFMDILDFGVNALLTAATP